MTKSDSTPHILPYHVWHTSIRKAQLLQLKKRPKFLGII